MLRISSFDISSSCQVLVSCSLLALAVGCGSTSSGGGGTSSGGSGSSIGGAAPAGGATSPSAGAPASGGAGAVSSGTGGASAASTGGAGVGGALAVNGGSAGVGIPVTGGSPGMPGASGGGSSVAGATGSAGNSGSAGNAGAGDFGLAGPSRCATAGVPLCEDFESGLNSSLWTTTQSGDATAVVDALHSARGTKALHVKTIAGAGHAFITERMTFPATNNTLYARMFIYLGDALTTDGHFSLAEGDGTGNGASIRFGGQNKVFGVGTDGGASGDWTDKDTKLIAAQTWICTEFEFKADTNEFHVFVDDAERTTLNRGVNQHANFVMPQFTSLWFGYWMYNMNEPQELWIDEIAVDYKPIGCTK